MKSSTVELPRNKMPRTLFECGLTDAILYWTDVPLPQLGTFRSCRSMKSDVQNFCDWMHVLLPDDAQPSPLRPCSVLLAKLVGRPLVTSHDGGSESVS